MRRRWVKVLIVTVVVLAGLFVAADRIAVHFADNFVADKAKQSYGFSGGTDSYTDVSIGGFPFLTQALGRDLDDVTLTAGNLTATDAGNSTGGYLHIGKVALDMRDVTVASTFDSAEAQTVTGTVTISYADLSDAVTRMLSKGGALTVAAAPGAAAEPPSQAAKIRVRGPYDGRELTSNGTIRVAGDEVQIEVPGAAGQGPDWTIGLPRNLGFTAVRAASDGIVISVVGHQIPLGA
jgi:hypothetical protein